MEEKKYLTVREFADKAGISKQAVYQQLNKKFKKFVKVVDGAKVIDIAALNEFYNKNNNQGVEQDLNNEQSTLVNMIEILKQQLEIKDNLINDLTRLLDQEQQLAKMEKQKTLPAAFNVEVSEQIDNEPIQVEPAAAPKKRWPWSR